jgi:hypothetical protein
MLDVEFTDTVASALSVALVDAQKRDPVSSNESPDYVRRVCRRAAWQLLFDLDGQSLLDLALAKLSAERDLRAAA